jgi:uncharacterized protein (DUF362 family)
MYDVSVVSCRNYEENEIKKALVALIDSIGGLDWLTEGMCVAIKVNLVTFAKPEKAVTTHPTVVCELIKLLRDNRVEEERHGSKSKC